MASLKAKKLYFSRSRGNGFRWIYKDKQVNIQGLQVIEGDSIEYGWLSERKNLFVRRLDIATLAIYRLFITDLTDDFGRNYIALSGFFININEIKEITEKTILFSTIFNTIHEPNISANDEDQSLESEQEVELLNITNVDKEFFNALEKYLDKDSFNEDFVVYEKEGEYLIDKLDKISNFSQNEFLNESSCDNTSEITLEEISFIKAIREIGLTIDDFKQLKKLLTLYSDLEELCKQKKAKSKSEEATTIKIDPNLSAEIAVKVTEEMLEKLRMGITLNILEEREGSFKDKVIEKNVKIKYPSRKNSLL